MDRNFYGCYIDTKHYCTDLKNKCSEESVTFLFIFFYSLYFYKFETVPFISSRVMQL